VNDYRYFVLAVNGHPYRVYDTENYPQPADNDTRCIWLGNDGEQARQACKEANENRKRKEAADAPRLF